QKPLPKREVNDERPYSPNSGVGTYETTYLEDYTKKVIKENTDYLKDQPIIQDRKPYQPSQQGYINFDTTYIKDYKAKESLINQARYNGPIDDHEYVTPSEPGTYDTTYTDDYTKKQLLQRSSSRERNEHLKSNIIQSSSLINSKSTYESDYQAKDGQRQQSYAPNYQYVGSPTGQTNYNTTYQQEYQEKQSDDRNLEENRAKHLQSTAFSSSGKFTDESTYARDFKGISSPKHDTNVYEPDRSYIPTSGAGTYETTYLEDYQKKTNKEIDTSYLKEYDKYIYEEEKSTDLQKSSSQTKQNQFNSKTTYQKDYSAVSSPKREIEDNYVISSKTYEVSSGFSIPGTHAPHARPEDYQSQLQSNYLDDTNYESTYQGNYKKANQDRVETADDDHYQYSSQNVDNQYTAENSENV
ncbi:MAG: hypothetical protein EZS28_047662, partial [Streblomastix strix]